MTRVVEILTVATERRRKLLHKLKRLLKKGGRNKKGNNFGKSKSKLRANLVDSDGVIMIYHECDSTKHFVSNCSHAHGKVEETNMTVDLILVTVKADSGTGSILVKSMGKGILDQERRG